MRILFHTSFSVAVLLLLFSSCAPSPSLRISAAAGMTEAVQEIADSFSSATGTKVYINFASSGTLAQQILSGAPADLYFSANTLWMDKLERENKLVEGSRIDVAGNDLVLISRENSSIRIHSLSDLTSSEITRVAIADPSHGPAGLYAKESLESSGLWEEVEDKLLPAMTVRAVLAYVARGEAEVGFVFSTDARLVDGVEVVYTIPARLHSPIRFQAAIVAGGNTGTAWEFMQFLRTEGLACFSRYGFKSPEE